jgi:hypothetical protein
VGALTQAFENISQNHNPSSPSQIARPNSAMSKDPQDYLDVHRAITLGRDDKKSLVGARKIQDGKTILQKFKGLFKRDVVDDGYGDKASSVGSEEPRPRKSMGAKRSNSLGRLRFAGFQSSCSDSDKED